MISNKIYKKLAKHTLRKIRIDSSKDVDFLQNLICNTFCKIGIGFGGDVESSGEDGVFALLKQSNPPYCIFDVGANVGKYLDLIIKSLNSINPTLNGGGGNDKVANCHNIDWAKIHCFEPSLHTFKILQDSYHKNYAKYNNITLNNFGLGVENGSATLYYDKKGSGIDFKESEEVKIITLDKYCQMHNISHIHLLKMDVEGHELDILRGGTQMFAKNAIDIATFEFGGSNIDTRTFFQDFWYFFTEHKMQLYRILPNGILHKIPAYSEAYEQFTTTNFVAVRRGRSVREG